MRVSGAAAWSVAGWAVFAASCLLVAAGAALGDDAPFPEDAVLAIGFTGLAALVLSQRPGSPVGLVSLSPVLSALAYALQAYAGSSPSPNLPAEALAGWTASWVWLPGLLPVLTVLLLVLPDGRLPSRRWRPVGWLVTAMIVVFTFVAAVVPGPGRPPGPVEIPALLPLLPSDQLWAAALLAAAVACLVAPISRWRGAGPRQRAQLLWILLGATAFVLGFVLNPVLPAPWSELVSHASSLSLPLAFGVAVLRHGLLELNRWLYRILLALVVAVVLVGIYVAGQLLLGGGPVAAGITTVAAGLVSPLLTRLVAGRIRRLVYGPAGEPGPVLARLARRLGTTSEPADVLCVLAANVLDALPVTHVRIVLTSDDYELHQEERGASGAGDVVRTVELQFAGSVLGTLTAAGRRHLDDAEQTLLDGMADTASAAVAAAHRALALQRSREALVFAREQERRRIARDLHDGVGPVLSGLGFTLDALRASLDDRDRAEAVAGQAATSVREAAQLVRRVATELRPAALDQLGLAGSLAELAAQHSHATLRVELDIGPDDGPPVAAATEVAAYALIAEAVTNTARHAQASRCRIRVRLAPHAITFSVLDDGVGLQGSPAGLGRTSMTERAAELGGWCQVSSGTGKHPDKPGTLVRVHLPRTAETAS